MCMYSRPRRLLGSAMPVGAIARWAQLRSGGTVDGAVRSEACESRGGRFSSTRCRSCRGILVQLAAPIGRVVARLRIVSRRRAAGNPQSTRSGSGDRRAAGPLWCSRFSAGPSGCLRRLHTGAESLGAVEACCNGGYASAPCRLMLIGSPPGSSHRGLTASAALSTGLWRLIWRPWSHLIAWAARSASFFGEVDCACVVIGRPIRVNSNGIRGTRGHVAGREQRVSGLQGFGHAQDAERGARRVLGATASRRRRSSCSAASSARPGSRCPV